PPGGEIWSPVFIPGGQFSVRTPHNCVIGLFGAAKFETQTLSLPSMVAAQGPGRPPPLKGEPGYSLPSGLNKVTLPRVFVIHENGAWVEPLRREFAMLEVPFSEWFLDEGMLDLTMEPPEGVFYNRMSASSHTRGHRYAPEFTAAVLAWLKHHGRIVVNGERALQLEVSKVAQYEALKAFGIATPDTIAVIGRHGVSPL